jgi:hypothetical protein
VEHVQDGHAGREAQVATFLRARHASADLLTDPGHDVALVLENAVDAIEEAAGVMAAAVLDSAGTPPEPAPSGHVRAFTSST